VIQKTSASAPVTSDYLYTSDGLRLKRTSNGVVTVYHYDLAGNLIGESDANGGNFKAHVYFAGTRLATVAADGTVCYHHNNHLETPTMMTDDDGDVVWRADYKPFGQASVDSESTVVNDFRFPGQVFDKETGYHYNWNRYYDSETGRYLTGDPIGLTGGMNLYSYVLGNPINASDSEGLLIDGGVVSVPVGYLMAGAIASGIAYYGAPVAADVGQWIGEAYNEARRARSKQEEMAKLYPDIPNEKCDGKCPPCPDVDLMLPEYDAKRGLHYHRWRYHLDPKTCLCRFGKDSGHF
jgi:RHS repeat-associated protein